MGTLIKTLSIFIGILVGSCLLSGAGIMFESWYKFPANFSRFVIMLIIYYFFAQLGVYIYKKIFQSKENVCDSKK